ncbi:MAG: hypothetical protein ACE5HO_18415 [bacterium]
MNGCIFKFFTVPDAVVLGQAYLVHLSENVTWSGCFMGQVPAAQGTLPCNAVAKTAPTVTSFHTMEEI